MSGPDAEKDAPTMIRWAGVDRRGNGRTGFAVADDPAEWVRLHFNAGWRTLVARSSGREVGRIAVRDGRRTWWAESVTSPAARGTDV